LDDSEGKGGGRGEVLVLLRLRIRVDGLYAAGGSREEEEGLKNGGGFSAVWGLGLQGLGLPLERD
jgi:hypothetical protein